MTGNNKGRITQIIGAVLDIRFGEGNLPEINEAIVIPGKDGGELFVMGETMKKVESSGKLKGINPEASQDIDPAAEREAMFDYMAVEEGARFYDPGMHGIDWPAMTEDYRKFLPHINNNEATPSRRQTALHRSVCSMI